MDDLDRALAQLRTMSVPARTSTMEGDVMMGIDAERRAAAVTSAPALGLAAMLALGIGIGGAMLPAGVTPAGTAAGFLGDASLAPSTLLANSG
ncbi:hypothetical protein GCM10011529_29420 [Polymorphobacter glacialis]|uniref:Uncharacterized protein n=1 Tax=Sandarakinorhabdus glacialis TaxID=1614636 RepID=A0A917A0N4_9SPHN|nr:hypothetical protein [Polymorphobacter glacialis]GGE20916.1 hypothetical protein GCM10011529_29420 [Polymorphobacter glacialis]